MIDVGGDLTGVGTLLVGVATLIGTVANRSRAKRIEEGTKEIHKTVNGAASAQLARVEQLADTITDAGLPVPPRPADEAGAA